MSQTAHEELAHRDFRIPGLSVLLDPDALLATLAALLPADAERPTGVTPLYRRYRPGTRLTAGLLVRYPDGDRHAFARAFPADAAPAALAEEARYARQWTARTGGHAADIAELVEPRLRGPLRDPALGLALGPPVDDREIPAVRHLAAAPHNFGFPAGGSAHTLDYRPGHRWTGRIDDAEGRPTYVLRACSKSVNAAAYLALAAAGLAVPDLVRVSRYGLLATRWTPGEPLERVLAGERGAGETALARTGLLLARLHAVPPPRELSPTAERGWPRAAAAELADLLPGLAERAAAVAARCADALAASDGPQVLVHGGFRADQVLMGERGPALVDLDGVRAAPPAVDLGSFAAGEYAAGRAPGADPATALGPLLEGYLSEAPVRAAAAVRRTLGAGTAAALLEQAVAPFRHGAPDWPARAAALVTAAESVLEGG